MKRIATNTLTGWAAALFLSYWIIGAFIPGMWLAIGVRLTLFFCGVAALWEWGPSALNILRERQSPPNSRGEILSLLGIATMAGGVTYSSLWGLTWYALGTPVEWLSTPHSMFGSAMMALGLGLVYRSTDIKRDVVRPVNWWVIAVLLVVVSVAAFFLGTKWQATQQAAIASQIVEARNECPDETPVAGNRGSRGWVYHTPGGIYYSQTVPEACFETEDDARLAGYRPAGR